MNLSLGKVQPTPNTTFFAVYGCGKLCAVEGCFKLESIKNIDKKIIRYLGLESILEKEMGFRLEDKQNAYTKEVSIKISYEFGIFSTYVLGKTLPCFRYRETGSTISFRVPSYPKGSRISGLNVCFLSTAYSRESLIWDVEVNNKTKAVVWKYTPTVRVTCKQMSNFKYIWLSLWRTGNLLDDGDEIVVGISLSGSYVVDECRVNFLYDYDEVQEDNQNEMDEEKRDTNCMFNQISWTDRLQIEISDYVHSGKTYCFKIGGATDVPNIEGISDLIVDWWGLRADRRCRYIEAGYVLLQFPSINVVYALLFIYLLLLCKCSVPGAI
ncbi:hypothetical protein HanXRQr2_Chr10g0441201 [Helianthus annuus]|uniref:Uncharacterized protein n=1 Tax=Helianthus annuus TaxID=4232 RepID=A0A9K3HXV1_HELAN|nr:hypothetical protein HanXRQr2_Chr10g0441201 [Helianthus annuus]